MLLEIDTNYLIQHQLTAHQFLILKLISDGDLKQLKTYLNNTLTFNSFNKDARELYNKGYLVDPASEPIAFNKLTVSKKFRETISFIEDPFEEFFKAYPVKVLRPDGDYDYLRVDQKRSKKIYQNIINNNIVKHQFILRCLKSEIKDKAARGQMSFFKRMPTWLTSESWKAYEDIAQGSYDTTLDENNIGYGQDIE